MNKDNMPDTIFRSSDDIITTRFMLDIADFEGFASKPYVDAGGTLTIGYGHTGKDVKKTTRFTSEQAANTLYEDLMTCYHYLRTYYDVSTWTLGMKQCFISFVFNNGIGNLRKSTMNSMLLSYQNSSPLNRGYIVRDLATQLRRWVFCRGNKLNGLVRRREFEVSLLNIPE